MEQSSLEESDVPKKNTSPRREYFKLIATMMGVLIVVPALGFIVLFPLITPLLTRMPLLFVLIPVIILAYMGIAIYWFFKKGLYQKMVGASVKYGMQRSKKIMKNLPEETKKEMMQNEMVEQFKKELKEEIKQEMQQEKQAENESTEKPQNSQDQAQRADSGRATNY